MVAAQLQADADKPVMRQGAAIVQDFIPRLLQKPQTCRQFGCRITSYNVCYTKLLRGFERYCAQIVRFLEL